MATIPDFKSHDEIAWCPGCGDFGILNALQKALVRLNKAPKDILMVSGIGQAAKTPHYVKANCFNGLHGRALPAAIAAKIANRNLTVIVTTGEGDCYGEGGNHFLHNIRRNVDITLIVHDNQIYGLTKGQASPTTEVGLKTKVQTEGVINIPFHPLEAAIALGCGFVARGYSADSEHLASLIVEGVGHKGFSLIDVLQPCVSFNKVNTYQWYAKHIYKLEEGYNPSDKMAAYKKAQEWSERIPLGVIYKTEQPTFEEKSGIDKKIPLVDELIEHIDIQEEMESFV
ncbi:MAG TPA: 2-oxoacid:ferredoxin oxidoreductase subunit beta [Candidatus Omnitrophota bacterium]|nr:2-oxoacid:ferredoxin oxidoreductase subunit beta [Candidatus Omnitrophota bacterium]HPD84761.1 2-oxoacid:ferredoxin oxidoreductase subunit beta [Candidatus Omnitrophota bacterium]HRZ03619.1 2-oxoacid:ferredoxin oxidoreductase subunit beta [Candidatus Omnitrophota bacterium]